FSSSLISRPTAREASTCSCRLFAIRASVRDGPHILPICRLPSYQRMYQTPPETLVFLPLSQTNSGLTVPFSDTTGLRYFHFPSILTARIRATRLLGMASIVPQF